MLHVNETALGAAVSNATKTLTAMAVSDLGGLSPASRLDDHYNCYLRTYTHALSVQDDQSFSSIRNSCIQHIRRVLVLAERYICSIEEQHPSPRSLPPHGSSFTGTPVMLYVTCDSNRMDVNLEVTY